MDFWVGEWDVTNEGSKAGVNRITKEEAGCLIHEQWTGNESIREERARLDSIRSGKSVSPREYWRD